MSHDGFTYILAIRPNGPLRVGATENILQDMREHRGADGNDHPDERDSVALVHLEHFDDLEEALRREEQLKTWERTRKLDLIREYNPRWQDLYVEACRTYGP